MRFESTTWLCDCCAVLDPVWRYDLPSGTPLLIDATTPGKNPTLWKNAGGFVLCDLCRKIVDGGFQVSKMLARHVVETNPKLNIADKDHRAIYRKFLERFYDRIIPLLSNPRPVGKKGDDPMDAVNLVDDGPRPSPGAPSSN